MVDYKVTVSTANLPNAGTFSKVYIKLFGTATESEREQLTSTEGALYLVNGDKTSFTVSCSASLGKLFKIELDKESLPLFSEDLWLPDKVVVTSPEGDTYNFPIYRWISDSNKPFSFREGKALRVSDDDDPGRESRRKELTQRKKDYRWDEETVPHGLKAENLLSLPGEVHFPFSVFKDFIDTAFEGLSELQMKGLADIQTWSNFDAIHQVFSCKRNDAADYVQEHWKEDAFFGYQYLNGVNPMMIRRCTALPDNFLVTGDKVFPSGQYSLESEMKNGNIFLCDYQRLDGLKPNTINGKEQYLMAPLVLLHKTPKNTLVPVAIQLKQTPAEDNPIFYPTDSEYDWLTAKIFVRSADVIEHQINVYLLRNHMMAEVFAVSLLRNMPMVHPLHKLLVPHTHYILQINCLFRLLLISETGVLTQCAACSRDGMKELAKKSLPALTYSSLCIKDDIKERGLENMPNFYYRDDGLRLWNIINKFVEGVLGFYYKKDAEVQNDSELQKWISDIFEHGFSSKAETGIPQSLATVAELVKFVTMVIFTCSGQHSAVTAGQYDYGGWMPNAPITLQLPPPTTKGSTSEATILETFPDVRTTVLGMFTKLLSSHQSEDFIPLGKYPADHFSEATPLKLIKDFQAELAMLSTAINTRNKSLALPYTYMDPAKIANNYVQEHWKEDAFFGYQYLNGVNPMMIRRCTALPDNFLVTGDKVFPSGQYSLESEMKNGNIFLCDYQRLDGLKPNTINGKEQYLMAPLVLLHKTPKNTLVPVAIQLKQTPAEDNPIFYPTDSEYDWLTAKIFVRSADVIEHQINVYLLRNHMMAEVFAVSLLRNMPMVHPLHKLLVPHTHYILQINCLFRLLLISETGVLTQCAACSRDGMKELAKKSLPALTYSSLCIKDDIKERGLENMPNFYYRDDGLRLWNIINKFVEGVLGFYYKKDAEVQNDSELQKWISDIFEHGFSSKAETGIPQSLATVAELVKFVTMVIFTCSGQHSAVTAGQYDYGGWMPNAPITLQLPPPTTKGSTSEATILETFPDVRTTVLGMFTKLLSSHQSEDFIPLGKYPADHFSEATPLKLIKDFQAELAMLSTAINTRNKSLALPYTYMDPAKIANSVSL